MAGPRRSSISPTPGPSRRCTCTSIPETDGAFIFDPKVGDLQVEGFQAGLQQGQLVPGGADHPGQDRQHGPAVFGRLFRRQVNNKIDYTGYTIAYDQYGYGYTAFYPNGPNAPGPLGNQDPTQYTWNWDTYTKLTNEIRLTSPNDQRFRWLVGAYAQHQTDNIEVQFKVDGLPPAYEVTGAPDSLYVSAQDRIDRDKAVFADATFDITDALKLSAGGRYFWVDNTLFGFFGYNDRFTNGEANCFAASTNDSRRPCINTDKRVTDSGETHRVNLQYQFDPERMVYATYSTGYRPGGNNRRVGIVPYTPDKLTNYELGWKTSWAQNTFRFNGALFWEKWTDVQLGIQGLNGITSILNVGDAESKGIEGELSWLAMEHLTLSLSGTYVDAKTTTQFCNADRITGQVTTSCPADEAVANVGARLPVTPKEKGNFTARYNFKAADFDSFVQGSVFHQSSTRNDLQEPIALAMGDSPAFTTFDFSAGFGRNNWQLQAFIQNAFDERGEINRFAQCNDFLGYCVSHPRVYPVKPQYFGIKFEQHF